MVIWRVTYRPFPESTATASDKLISASASANEAELELRFNDLFFNTSFQFVSAVKE
jgi:hypothetical protein